PLRIGAPPRVTAFYQSLLNRIETLPGVKAAGAASSLPLQGEVWGKHFVPLDRPLPTSAANVPNVQYRAVAGHYFNSLGIRLLKGRLLDEHDHAGAPLVVVVNEALARRYWPGQDPIGKKVLLTAPENLIPRELIPPGYHVPQFTVVGVVADVHYGRPDEEPAPAVHASIMQHDYSRSPYFTVRADGDPKSLIASIRGAIGQSDKSLPMANIISMEEMM